MEEHGLLTAGHVNQLNALTSRLIQWGKKGIPKG